MHAIENKFLVDHLIIMDILAVIYLKQASYRFDEAEELLVHVMEVRMARLGADHSNTLNSMANLALAFWFQGKWSVAEKIQVYVMEV